MQHEERMQIAEAFTKKIVKKYGKNIRTVAIAGLVAEGIDKEFSDLDLIIITKNPLMQPYHFTYKDCVVEPTYISEGDLKKVASVPFGIHGGSYSPKEATFLGDRNWLRWAYLLGRVKIIYGTDSGISTFMKLAKSIPKKRLAKQASHELPYVRALINHVRGMKGRSTAISPIFIVEFTRLAYEVVAMLNGRFYTGYDEFNESKGFKVIPNDFHNLVQKLQASTNAEEEETNMVNLFDSLQQCCKEHGAGMEYYDTLTSIKV